MAESPAGPHPRERACQRLREQLELERNKKQADDDTLHQFAMRIQARAIRRCGELLKTFQMAPQGGRPKANGAGAATVSQREAAEKAGMSKRQEVTAVRVANVPAADFDAAIDSDRPPTVTRLAALGTTPSTSKPAPNGFLAAQPSATTMRPLSSRAASTVTKSQKSARTRFEHQWLQLHH
jgi:hypothetical protein